MSQYVLNNACVQQTLGVGTDRLSNSTLLSALSTMVTLWPCHILGSKRATSCPTITEILPCCYDSTYPSEDNSHQVVVNRGVFELFTSCHISPSHHFEEKKGGVFRQSALFHSIHGRASLAMEGKSVLPMHRGHFVYKEEVCIKRANNLCIQD